jgi:DNA polymerase-3 subunit delta'
VNRVGLAVHPWNVRLAETLARSLDRLPHAFLLAGPSGLGKTLFAEWLGQLLLCDEPQPDGGYCGRCRGCRLVRAGSHADLHVVRPEAVYLKDDSLLSRYALRYPPVDKSKDSKESQAIRVDQIRSVIETSQGRPHTARRRILILSPADRMNINAANALLKLLEEPPPDSHLILTADSPMRLPATIRSRCVRVDFRIPEPGVALAWMREQGVSGSVAPELLALSGGAPIEAIQLEKSGFLEARDRLIADLENLLKGKTDVVSCATQWRDLGAERCLRWFQGWLADLAVPASAALHNPGVHARLQVVQKRLHLKKLFMLADLVGQSRSRLGGALDEQLVLEETLIRWTELQTIPIS